MTVAGYTEAQAPAYTPAQMSNNTTNKNENKQGQQGLCSNPLGCYRMANGTNGRWCMPCEDQADNNQPMTNKERKQYELIGTRFGYMWKHKENGTLYGKSRRYKSATFNPFNTE